VIADADSGPRSHGGAQRLRPHVLSANATRRDCHAPRTVIRRLTRAIALFAVLAGSSARAAEIVTLWESAYVSARPGATVHLLLQADIGSGYVVVAQQARGAGLLPLSLKLNDSQYLKTGPPSFPTAQASMVGERQVAGYAATLRIMLPVTISPQAPAGEIVLSGELRYQACDEARCLSAHTLPIALVIEIQPNRE
jgi:DsbC/DsbD-like thiol-disulfide interchange protein